MLTRKSDRRVLHKKVNLESIGKKSKEGGGEEIVSLLPQSLLFVGCAKKCSKICSKLGHFHCITTVFQYLRFRLLR